MTKVSSLCLKVFLHLLCSRAMLLPTMPRNLCSPTRPSCTCTTISVGRAENAFWRGTMFVFIHTSAVILMEQNEWAACAPHDDAICVQAVTYLGTFWMVQSVLSSSQEHRIFLRLLRAAATSHSNSFSQLSISLSFLISHLPENVWNRASPQPWNKPNHHQLPMLSSRARAEPYAIA